MRQHFRLLACLAVVLAPQVVTAAPIQGGTATYDYFNSFFTRLFPGTPLNPGTEPIDVPVESLGVFTQVWQPQVGFTIVDELTSIRQAGVLPGDPPIPFEIFAGIEETPELGPFIGSITGIVQDPTDPGFAMGNPSSLVSGSRQVGGPFAQQLIDGTFLYTVESYFFEGQITALPFPVGQEFIGRDDVEVRVRLGSEIDPLADPVVGLVLAGGVVRIIPEPASYLGLVTAAVIALGCCRRTKNK